MFTKRNAPEVLEHRTGANKKNFHTYNPTQFRKSQALKQRRREIVEELIALPVTLLLLGGIFWGFWLLRGVV